MLGNTADAGVREAISYNNYRQGEFLLADEHYAAYVSGIGGGKTYSLVEFALLAAHGQVGSNPAAIPTPNVGVITAPTYPMLRDATLRTFMDVCRPYLRRGSAGFNRSEMRATFWNGSEILFRSTSDPEALRGPSIAWWGGDEAALYSTPVWGIMIGRLRQFGRFGYARLATTPRGRNWVYKRFVQKATPDYKLITGTTMDNFHLSAEWIESLKEEYAEGSNFYRQELLGMFVGFEGLVYAEFDRNTHAYTDATQMKRFKRVIAGVDWGYVNAGVILIAGVDGDDRIEVVHEEYARKRRPEEWALLAKQLRAEWRVDQFFCDPSSPENINLFVEQGLDAVAADNRVLPGIDAVRNRLVVRGDGLPGLRVRYTCANLLAEFEQYQWMEGREGFKDAPKKSNDHAQDSLRYLCMGAAVESGGGLSGTIRTDGRMRTTDRRRSAA